MTINPDHALLRCWTVPTAATACSPIAALLDLRVEAVDRSRGQVTVRFTVPPELRNAGGEPADRAVAAMLDCALSFAALATLEPPTTIVTATLRIEAVAGCATSRYTATAAVAASNDLTIFVRGCLQDGSARLVALASATLRIVDAPS